MYPFILRRAESSQQSVSDWRPFAAQQPDWCVPAAPNGAERLGNSSWGSMRASAQLIPDPLALISSQLLIGDFWAGGGEGCTRPQEEEVEGGELGWTLSSEDVFDVLSCSKTVGENDTLSHLCRGDAAVWRIR